MPFGWDRPAYGVRLVVGVATALNAAVVTAAQPASALIDQASARIRELHSEAERLTRESATLLIELRRLQIERDIKAQEVTKAELELGQVTQALDTTTRRVAELDAQRLAGTTGVSERLIELYKRGRGGYVPLLFRTDDLRALGRMSRGVAAVARLDRARFDAHRRLLADAREAMDELSARQQEVAIAQDEARRARQALDGAISAHTRRIAELDRRRDLAARYVGDLQRAQAELERRIGGLDAERPATLPLAPFRGALEWPVAGRVLSRFGRGAGDRFGTPVVRSGIEIGSRAGDAVRAVHGGTVVHAAPFTGFGVVVIVDHGEGAFTVYGHLGSAVASQDAVIDRGAVVGYAGRTAAGVEATYFELRIDGRAVDPVQWLRSPR
ncbi:MAG: murein hydrolase activator EnvC family protein [Acidobacteriota bacterium]